MPLQYNTNLDKITEVYLFDFLQHTKHIPVGLKFEQTTIYKSFYYETEQSKQALKHNQSAWLSIIFEWENSSCICFYNIINSQLKV